MVTGFHVYTIHTLMGMGYLRDQTLLITIQPLVFMVMVLID